MGGMEAANGSSTRPSECTSSVASERGRRCCCSGSAPLPSVVAAVRITRRPGAARAAVGAAARRAAVLLALAPALRTALDMLKVLVQLLGR